MPHSVKHSKLQSVPSHSHFLFCEKQFHPDQVSVTVLLPPPLPIQSITRGMQCQSGQCASASRVRRNEKEARSGGSKRSRHRLSPHSSEVSPTKKLISVDFLGPMSNVFLKLDLHITSYSRDQLKVSQTVLDLNAVSLYTSVTRSRGDQSLHELEARGLLILGKHNLQVEKALRTNFASLVASSRVKKKDLEMELFVPQVLKPLHFIQFLLQVRITIVQGPGNSPDREFMLKRQLIGFYLQSSLKDSHLRLPVEAINRLASSLYSGKFSKKDDEAILAWVDQHGPKKWTALARSLDRHYIHAPASVMNRFFN